MTRLLAAVAAVSSILVGAEPASAHRLDEYLQALRVDVRRDAIVLELDLTPGATLAPEILAAVDPDGDGVMESADRDAYVHEVAQRLQLTIDGRPSALVSMTRDFPSSDAFRTGTGVVRLSFIAGFHQTTGSHQIVVNNGYRSEVSVYLANALQPDPGAVTISSQRRDARQQSLTIDYVVGRQMVTAASASWTGGAALLIGLTAYWRRRQRLGANLRRTTCGVAWVSNE
jgi:hypothetical protein